MPLCITCVLIALSVTAIGQPVFSSRADSVAGIYHRASLQNLPRLTHLLTAPFETDVDKFRAIYRWVCDNISGGYHLHTRNQRQRKKLKGPELDAWNRKAVADALRNLREKQRTVCSGYAYLIREMCILAGIEAVTIDGYGRTSVSNVGGEGVINHTWNAVKLGGEWHLCDATWSAGAHHPQSGAFVRNFEEAYFLPPPQLFIQKHFPVDSTWSLLEPMPSLAQFLSAPIFYPAASRYGIVDVTPSTLCLEANRDTPIEIRFRRINAVPMRNVSLQLVASGDISNVPVTLEPVGQGEHLIRHQLTRRGSFVLHLLVDGEHLVSYEARVK